MIDCVIIGFDETNYEDYVNMAKSRGEDTGAYRDLSLNFVVRDGRPLRCMDLLNLLYAEGRSAPHRPFHNADFLWPVVTYLGTYLSRRGFSFDYVNLFHLEREKLRRLLESGQVRSVAITTTLYFSPEPVREIVDFVREHGPGVKVIVGGPYIYNQSRRLGEGGLQALLRHLGADYYVVSAEGEAALAGLLTSLKAGAGTGGVANVAYSEGGRYVMGRVEVEANSLEENMVDYGLFGAEEVGEMVSLRTAKSCPFSCAFCDFPSVAGKYKYLSVEQVEHELDELRRLGGVTTLTFIDDTFNVPKQRFKELLRMMIRNNYGFKWNCFYRCDQGDAETVRLMGQAGCEGVFLGIESGSDAMLERMNKTARRRHYLEAIPQLRDAGILVDASLIIGYPGETYETVQETIDFIEEARPDFFGANLWYCNRLTPVWQRREEYGLQGEAYEWSHATMDSRTACELIEKIFLSIENSIWLPEDGFEMWSVYYLQRRGLSVEQIKAFTKGFFAAVRQKLLDPLRPEMSEDLVEYLRKACSAGRAAAGEAALELYSASRYAAAERFWLDRFAEESEATVTSYAPVVSRGDGLRAGAVSATDTAAGGAFGRGSAEEVWPQLPGRTEGTEWATVLAGLALALSRLRRRRDLTILAARRRDGVRELLPVRARIYEEESFGELVAQVAREVESGREHEQYAFWVLGRGERVGRRRGWRPAFDVWLACGKSRAEVEELCAGAQALMEATGDAGWWPSLGVEFEESGGGRAEVRVSGGVAGEAEALRRCMTEALRLAQDGMALVPVGDILADWRGQSRRVTLEVDTASQFNF
jgi:anaerobic magnesium-protoporphyrin IX monomethyl ester cyclase